LPPAGKYGMLRANMRRLVGRLSLVLAGVVLFLAVLCLVLAGSLSPAPLPPLPNPNGYDDFIQASLLVSEQSGDYPEMDLARLQALAATNAAGLKLVAVGLSRPCRTPLDLSTNFGSLPNLAGLKRLAQALAAEGKLAELQSRPGDAAQAYLSAVRLGCAVRHGAIIIYALVGTAIEAIGCSGLERVVSDLNAAQCRETVKVLQQADAEAEPTEVLLQNERDWARRRFGLLGQLQRLVTFRMLKQSEDKVVSRVKTQQTRARILQVQLAARAYELDQGRRPGSLADLVPAYLKAIPQDPLTGTNMSYRP
jgi:hypothetical protein